MKSFHPYHWIPPLLLLLFLAVLVLYENSIHETSDLYRITKLICIVVCLLGYFGLAGWQAYWDAKLAAEVDPLKNTIVVNEKEITRLKEELKKVLASQPRQLTMLQLLDLAEKLRTKITQATPKDQLVMTDQVPKIVQEFILEQLATNSSFNKDTKVA